MLIHPTHEALRALKLDGMAEVFAQILAQDGSRQMDPVEWIGLMLDRESSARDTRRFQTRLRAAKLRETSILPRYLRKAKSIEEVLPWLYLKGVSTGDFTEALEALLGPNAKGLFAKTVTRLKADWWQDYEAWQKRDLHRWRDTDCRNGPLHSLLLPDQEYDGIRRNGDPEKGTRGSGIHPTIYAEIWVMA